MAFQYVEQHAVSIFVVMALISTGERMKEKIK
jgi:hypothetical protein